MLLESHKNKYCKCFSCATFLLDLSRRTEQIAAQIHVDSRKINHFCTSVNRNINNAVTELNPIKSNI
jgi:hypothetical protein